MIPVGVFHLAAAAFLLFGAVCRGRKITPVWCVCVQRLYVLGLGGGMYDMI